MGSPIGGAIEHIKFMSKFMIDNIMALFRMAAVAQNGIPDKNDRTLLKGLSDNGMGGFYGGKSNFKMT